MSHLLTHHADEACSIIAIEEERVEPAEKRTQRPSSLKIADGRQRQIDRAEEQVRDGEADHENRGGLRAQLLVPHQADDCDLGVNKRPEKSYSVYPSYLK